MTDTTFSAIASRVDDRCNDHDRAVLAYLADLGDDTLRCGGVSLDALCDRFPTTPREFVFAAVARLEDRGYLPKGAIR